jgi:hypothetical protein
MPERELVTRDTLKRELVLNAVTKPAAISVGAAVAVAAFVLGAFWLLAVAVAVYAGMAVATFFDEEEAARVGEAAYGKRDELTVGKRGLPAGLSPEIGSLLERARDEEFRIFETVSGSDHSFEGVMTEVGSLTTEMERIAGRAQAIRSYLDGQRPFEAQRRLQELRATASSSPEADRARERAVRAIEDQIRLGDTMRSELGRFEAEMEHLIASLAIVHGQLVRMSVVNDTRLQEDVARELADLRERVGAYAEGMREAVSQLDG